MATDENSMEDLDELGKEMEDALKNIGADIPAGESAVSAGGNDAQSAVDALLAGAGEPAPSKPSPGGSGGGSSNSGDVLSELGKKQRDDLQFILDIPFDVTVEVGRAEMVVKDVVNLGQGSVIELDRLTGENLDVIINGRVIGQGEVVVVNDKFGLRLKKVITPQERIEQLR